MRRKKSIIFLGITIIIASLVFTCIENKISTKQINTHSSGINKSNVESLGTLSLVKKVAGEYRRDFPNHYEIIELYPNGTYFYQTIYNNGRPNEFETNIWQLKIEEGKIMIYLVSDAAVSNGKVIPLAYLNIFYYKNNSLFPRIPPPLEFHRQEDMLK
jgi:hypothetical protein